MTTQEINTTPITDSVGREIGRLGASWVSKEIYTEDFIVGAEAQLDKLRAVERELEAHKDILDQLRFILENKATISATEPGSGKTLTWLPDGTMNGGLTIKGAEYDL